MRPIALLLPLLLSWTAPLLAADDSPSEAPSFLLSLQVENDLFGDGFDRHYTNGLRINAVSDRQAIPDFVTDLAEELNIPQDRRPDHYRMGFVLGQSIFTPEEITNPALIPDDRPYAGWLYLGAGIAVVTEKKESPFARGKFDQLDLFELNIGLVGPESFADDVQIGWHRLIGSPRPAGWAHQLNNELGVNVYGSRMWRHPLTPARKGLKWDLIPHLSYAVGNVHTHAGIGASLRVGSRLDGDFGPPRIRPSLPAGGFFEPHPGRRLDWYLFAGLEARGVARNIFLDGNTFTDSHHVDRESWVGDLQAGLVVTYGDLRLSFTNVWRTDEFTSQSEPTEFGAVTVTWHY